jgi:hypothetical protein
MRIPIPKEKSLTSVILGFANGFAGVCEWLEAVEQGEEPMRAAKKAYRNVQRRKVAVKRSERKLKEGHQEARARAHEEGGVVIDVTPHVRERKTGTR